MNRPDDITLFPAVQGPEEGASPALRHGDVPAIVMRSAAGAVARYAWEEFFDGELPNRHTRTAYSRAVRQFLAWCEGRGLELERISPGHVGQYMARYPGSIPTKKQHLAAIRRLFDRLVVRHVVILNPAASVR